MKQPSIAAVQRCCSGSMRRLLVVVIWQFWHTLHSVTCAQWTVILLLLLLARGPPTGPTVVVNSGRSRCTIIGTSSRFRDRAFAAARPPLWNSLPTAWLHDSFCRKPRAYLFVRGTSARLGPVVAVVLGGVYTFLLTYFLTQWPSSYTGSCSTRSCGRDMHIVIIISAVCSRCAGVMFSFQFVCFFVSRTNQTVTGKYSRNSTMSAETALCTTHKIIKFLKWRETYLMPIGHI